MNGQTRATMACPVINGDLEGNVHSVGIWYPASFPAGYKHAPVEDMHCTLMYIGETKDVYEKFTPIDIMYSLEEEDFLLIHQVEVVGRTLFGKEYNIPVLLLRETAPLMEQRKTVEKCLARYNIDWSKDFAYKPHVTVSEEIYKDPPNMVTLMWPEIWWGDSRYLF